MNASERLKALATEWHGHQDDWEKARRKVRCALPELIAMVEGLERIRMLAEPHPSQSVLFVIADTHLAALDDALTTKGEQ